MCVFAVVLGPYITRNSKALSRSSCVSFYTETAIVLSPLIMMYNTNIKLKKISQRVIAILTMFHIKFGFTVHLDYVVTNNLMLKKIKKPQDPTF